MPIFIRFFRTQWSWTSRIGRFKTGLLKRLSDWWAEKDSDWSRALEPKCKPFWVICNQSLTWILLWMILFGIKCLTEFNIHQFRQSFRVFHVSKIPKYIKKIWIKIEKCRSKNFFGTFCLKKKSSPNFFLKIRLFFFEKIRSRDGP